MTNGGRRTMRMISRSPLMMLGCLSGLALSTAVAQTIDEDQSTTLPDFSTYRPVATATRISGEKPVLDGDLSDPVWQQAVPITDFFEVSPANGDFPSEKTTAYVLFDDDNLYFGIYAYDQNPNDIRANQMRRDPRLGRDDNIRIALDPLNTERDGYLFGVSPTGARLDGLLENNADFKSEWDALWQAKTKITDQGWVAEIAIPFRSISYDPNADSWGFQIIRGLTHKNERLHWSNVDQSKRGADFTQVGTLEGIDVETQGRGIEAQLFATVLGSRDWETRTDDISIEPSANIYYRFSPSLTGTLTLNTDFSDTPLDSRQVNTGRFSLFFPETRDFFLQDASVFEFGGRVFDRPNGLPFFSRRIGIVDGTPTDIVAGAKLSGQLGPANIGALLTRTDETSIIEDDESETIYAPQSLGALRTSFSVLDESKIGLVLTKGTPDGLSENQVGGVDFQYRNSALYDGVIIGADFVGVQSSSDDEDGNLLGASARWESQTWNALWRFKQIDEAYSPALGFSNRQNINTHFGRVFRGFNSEDKFLRRFELGVFTGRTDQLEDALADEDDLSSQIIEGGTKLDSFTGGFTYMRSQTNDEIFASHEKSFTLIETDFDLADEVLIPAGEYENDKYEIRFETNGSRTWSGELFLETGSLYNGTLNVIASEVAWRPNRHFGIELGHSLRAFDLPNGELDIHVGSLETEYNFTPDMNLEAEIQYDNVSEQMSIFSRYRWEMQPGRTLTVSLGHGAEVAEERFPRDFVSTGTSFSIRFGETLRF